MNITLTARELNDLVRRVFAPTDRDRTLAVLVDLPDEQLPDTADWRARRTMAAGWAQTLKEASDGHGIDVSLVLYRNVRANNADLPARAWYWDPALDLPATADEAEGNPDVAMREVLQRHRLALAPTELSATAPLKVLSRELNFRAATMPGFSPEMVPALRLDYTEVNRRVNLLKAMLDEATAAIFTFGLEGGDSAELTLDLRHRTAHASGGLLHRPGTAGNLPSGEAYIVPYEGEITGDPSRSAGLLPVQLEGELVLYRVENNRAVEVLSDGPVSRREAEAVVGEPAYANLAELGLGVLAAFGVKPVGEVLLDEKLGLHIAFGRSEHFGGQVGPEQFSSPAAVTHQDRVYIPELQPDVAVVEVDLITADGGTISLMRDGAYTIDF